MNRSERTSIDVECLMSEYWPLAERAQQLPSYFSHGWTPSIESNYLTPMRAYGKAWFTFEKKSDAVMFKLTLNLVDR